MKLSSPSPFSVFVRLDIFCAPISVHACQLSCNSLQCKACPSFDAPVIDEQRWLISIRTYSRGQATFTCNRPWRYASLSTKVGTILDFCYTRSMKGGRNVAHVKTAVSMDEGLFREAEEWAEKLGVSRSQLFANAVAEYVRERENEELLRRLNETHADGLDDEEKEYLERMRVYQGRLIDRLEGEYGSSG